MLLLLLLLLDDDSGYQTSMTHGFQPDLAIIFNRPIPLSACLLEM